MNQMHIYEALKIIELTPEDISFIHSRSLTVVQAKECMEIFKDLIKKQRKILAKKYHPDLPHGDAEKLKNMNNICDDMLKMEIRPVQQQPKPIIVRAYNSTTSSTWCNGTWYRH